MIAASMADAPGVVGGRNDCNHPAESQDCGIANSDQPQSRQTRTSGDGVIGGWLRVRGPLRYRRISAGIIDTAPDWHFGQIILTPQETADVEQPIWGESNSNWICAGFSTVNRYGV